MALGKVFASWRCVRRHFCLGARRFAESTFVVFVFVVVVLSSFGLWARCLPLAEVLVSRRLSEIQ